MLQICILSQTINLLFCITVRVSPSLTDAAMARLVQGTKVLAEGGLDHAFQQAFNILPGEELLNSYACYLSTTSGPVIGTLYLSTKRVAFCSDYSFCCYSSTGQPEWMYYKVLSFLFHLIIQSSTHILNLTMYWHWQPLDYRFSISE